MKQLSYFTLLSAALLSANSAYALEGEIHSDTITKKTTKTEQQHKSGFGSEHSQSIQENSAKTTIDPDGDARAQFKSKTSESTYSDKPGEDILRESEQEKTKSYEFDSTGDLKSKKVETESSYEENQ